VGLGLAGFMHVEAAWGGLLMEPRAEHAAAAFAAPHLLRSFKLRWIFWGVAAYYALRYMNKRGILPEQTNAALGLIDRGLDVAKHQVGMAVGHVAPQGSADVHH
jgi:hypothetical protein